MTVNLTGVANAQTVAVNLSNVTDEFSQVLANTTVNASFLLGDTNGDRMVNAGDAVQTRNRAGQAVDETNFRSDVNLDAFLNSGDTLTVRGQSGNSVHLADLGSRTRTTAARKRHAASAAMRASVRSGRYLSYFTRLTLIFSVKARGPALRNNTRVRAPMRAGSAVARRTRRVRIAQAYFRAGRHPLLRAFAPSAQDRFGALRRVSNSWGTTATDPSSSAGR